MRKTKGETTMKLTEKQKAKIRKEIEQEKRPRILNFETEINKKKNQDKTIEEIMQMVEESKEVAKTFINDPEERFQKRLAELKIQELDKVRRAYNKSRFTDFSLKTFKRFNGIIADFDELTFFLDEFICLVNVNDRTVNENWRIWGELKEAINTTDWRKACKAVRKEIPNITLKQFMLQNKKLTVAQAKKEFEELMASVPVEEAQIYADQLNQKYRDAYRGFKEKLKKDRLEDIENNKDKINELKEKLNLDELNCQSF